MGGLEKSERDLADFAPVQTVQMCEKAPVSDLIGPASLYR